MKRMIIPVFVALFLITPLLQADTTEATAGLRSDWALQLKEAEDKIISLAEAFPVEKYSWRPAEGIRSVGEVFAHIAGGNYFLPTFAGVQPPEGFPQDVEKTVTDKEKIIELMKQSFAHLHTAFDKLPDAEMDKKVDFFGKQMTFRNIYLLSLLHNNEHLGQAIAYARMNGVVPPWSLPKPAEKSE